jgi:hypothetical protein
MTTAIALAMPSAVRSVTLNRSRYFGETEISRRDVTLLVLP